MENSQNAPKEWSDPASFDVDYRVRPGRAYIQAFRDAYGDDYPAEVEPHSFITKTDLVRMVQYLDIGSGSVLVDLGCGRGGPGLWLARETGADLIGIDFSPNAIDLANQRIAEFGLVGRARFLVRDLCSTGLPDRSCDGAVSIDVLLFVPDKAAAIKEAARILQPDAKLIFTSYEDQDSDLIRTLLWDNGFEVSLYEEKPDWRRRQLICYGKILAQQDAILKEMGESGQVMIDEANALLPDGLKSLRHVFVVGRKRG